MRIFHLHEPVSEGSPRLWEYSHTTPIGLMGRAGIYWFSRRYNCELESFAKGECRFYNTGRLFRLSPRIEVIRLVSWGRFGNALVQLVNAFRVARHFRAHTLQFSQEHPYLAFSEIEKVGPFSLVVGQRPKEALTLEGRFFFMSPFPWRKGAPRNVASVISEFVRPILAPSICTPDPRVGENDLVVHFRGGDIFNVAGTRSAYLYGQPPLSYYLTAIERERPERIWLISDDDRNPCLGAAASALIERALLRSSGDVIVRRSCDLTEDIRIMMSARRLVASRGSFAYMIAHLSHRLRKAYFFEAMTYFKEPRRLPILSALGVDIVDVRDDATEYKSGILRRNWANSAEQRELMLSYPEERLKFTHRNSKKI